MKFVIATGNPGKLREMRGILAELGAELVPVTELFPDFEVEETGETFLENAGIKARAASRLTGLPAIADDSGLCVSALGGAPGVRSARYGGEECRGDAERTARLLREMEGFEERSAKFVSAIVCRFPDGREISAEGECRGRIALCPRGTGGFGYDPVFELEDVPGRTMAELGEDEKNAVSHRARALKNFKEKLKIQI